jgi:toxin CcdB
VARFDIFPNPYAPERSHTPYVLDVQNDNLQPLATRVVIPLRAPKGFGAVARGLNPVLEVNGKPLVLDTAALAPVPTHMLKAAVAQATRWRDEILDAIDTLFGAY